MKKNNQDKNKKTALNFEKATEQEKDYVAAILEEVRSNFRAFGESLEFVRQRSDATFEEVGRIREELSLMNGRLDAIEREVRSIRGELNEMKKLLTQKADIDYIKKLEQRLIRVERHLKLSAA